MSARPSVVVVGGGIAGASVGYELAPDHDVVVLESEPELGVHSTGRSAAVFLAGYGAAPVRALTRASEPLFARLEVDLELAPLLRRRGVLMAAWDDEGVEHLRRSSLDPATRFLSVDVPRVRDLCSALDVEGLHLAVYDPTASDIDVMALHAGYVRGLHRRGGRTAVGAQVVSVRRGPGGWVVTAADGRTWHGDVLVNAAGGWGDVVADLAGVAGHSLVARRRTIAIARSPVAVDPAWPVVVEANERWYFKPEGAGVLVSPADETPVAPCDVRPDPLDVATALDRVNAATSLQLRSVVASWAGLRTFTPDRCPVVGPDPAEPSFCWLVGQGGYGIQMAPALAVAAADLMRTGQVRVEGLDPASIAPRRFDGGVTVT